MIPYEKVLVGTNWFKPFLAILVMIKTKPGYFLIFPTPLAHRTHKTSIIRQLFPKSLPESKELS
jgi:hypothetical protein